MDAVDKRSDVARGAFDVAYSKIRQILRNCSQTVGKKWEDPERPTAYAGVSKPE